jgi:hypothetical protein
MACGSTEAHLGMEARSGATCHVAVPEPTLAGWQGLALQGPWQHVDARTTLCHLHMGTRSVVYRQWPPGPPWEKSRTHRWVHLVSAPLSVLELLI